MSSYRFFLLNTQGSAIDGFVEDCVDDRDALEKARAVAANRMVEIWQAGRHVALVRQGEANLSRTG